MSIAEQPVLALRKTPSRLTRVIGKVWSATIALAFLFGVGAGVAALGHATKWKLPKASALLVDDVPEGDDWCKEHGVLESACVECRPELFPRGPTYGWCKIHGVSECPLCHPDVAQIPDRTDVSEADRKRSARALAFAPREENDPKCKKHMRRIQLVSDEIGERLGFTYAPVTHGRVQETIRAPGEIAYDPNRVARIGSPVTGSVWRVEKRVGDPVKQGDVLALVDSAEVGKAKAEFQLALVQFELRRETLAKLRPMAGTTVPGKDVQAAEVAAEQAEVRLLTAEQSMANLGMSLRAEDVRGLSPVDLARRMQFLGLPDSLSKSLSGRTDSSNLLPLIAPFNGAISELTAVKDQSVESGRSLFVVADTTRMWLTLQLRQDDIERVKVGQSVRFYHTGHSGSIAWDNGTVAWVSPTAGEKTRTVPVRVELSNPSDRHRANTFGTAEVILRDEPESLIVPAGAVHWEGCCHIVFVRDKSFEQSGAPKVIHVRKVRLGAKDVPGMAGPTTEIAAGLLLGESVAVANSGVFRSELLKNDLGAG